MKKYVVLEFTWEEADVVQLALKCYLEQAHILQLRVAGVKIDLQERDFIIEAINLCNDAIYHEIDVIIYCKREIKWVLYSVATIASTIFYNEDQQKHLTQALIKLLFAAQDGE